MLKGLNSRIIRTTLCMMCIFISGTPLMAQDNSVYARFGVGLLGETNFIPSRSMGGLGATYRSTENVNFANPASYATLNLISFETGMSGSVNRTTTAETSERSGSVNLSYLSFALPLKKDRWVSTLGVVPFSQQNYLLADTVATGGSTGISNIFEGSGTIYTAYWGNGFKYKDLSLGLNIGYIFGNTDMATISVPLDSDGFLDNVAFASFERYSLKARGLYWNIGAIYTISLIDKIVDKNLRKELLLDVGLAYNSNYNMGSSSTRESSSYTVYSNLLNLKDDGESWADFLDQLVEDAADGENDGVSGADIDTFQAPSIASVNLRMPSNINAGYSFVRKVKEVEFWKAGFDFKWTQWSRYRGDSEDAGNTLDNSWRLAVGGEIFPLGSGSNSGDLKSKIFAQLKYRAGFYYMKSPISLRSTAIREFGINFGIAIPIRLRLVNDDGYLGYRGVHAFSLGFEVGSRGTKKNDLVRDNFVRINLGVALNDKWFVKRKYN